MYESVPSVHVLAFEGNRCALAQENDILFINRRRWLLSHLLKEAIDDANGDDRKHFLDQIVDGANNLLVFAQLTLPDHVDNGLIKEVFSITR